MEDEDICFCPACDGEGMEVGSLGYLTWYRCRNCGMDFSVQKAG